jgi:hypothetical protein
MQIEYFTFVGSFDGAIKLRGKWIRAKNLNYINKLGWLRWQGPPSKVIEKALSNPVAIDMQIFKVNFQDNLVKK